MYGKYLLLFILLIVLKMFQILTMQDWLNESWHSHELGYSSHYSDVIKKKNTLLSACDESGTVLVTLIVLS